jgi:hypothetical protein
MKNKLIKPITGRSIIVGKVYVAIKEEPHPDRRSYRKTVQRSQAIEITLCHLRFWKPRELICGVSFYRRRVAGHDLVIESDHPPLPFPQRQHDQPGSGFLLSSADKCLILFPSATSSSALLLNIPAVLRRPDDHEPDKIDRKKCLTIRGLC